MHRRHASILLALLLCSAVALAIGLVDPAAALGPDPGPASDPALTSLASQSTDDCAFPLTRTDATGAAVTVESDPGRIVALQPSAAQTMWEIGASEEVVGMPVGQYTADLEGYRRPANVAGADGFTTNVEAVVDLSPDLVLAPNVTSVETVRQLRRASLTVYHFREAESIEDVYAKTLLTGQLTGNCEGASGRVGWMRERIDRVREAVRGEDRPTVVYPLGGGVVAGDGTFLNELVVAGGGSNLAAEEGLVGYPQLSAEVIVDRDPQWLVLNDGLPRSAIQMDAYNRTTAIREDQVVRVNPNYANQPAPRIVYPIEAIARALHPEAMAAATGTATPSGADSRTTTAVDTTTAPTETDAPGQSGFGLVGGLAAIVVACLAAIRRPA